MANKISIKNHSKLFRHEAWRWLIPAFVLVAAIAVVAVSSKTSAASATLSFSPSSGSYTVGDTVTVAVNEDSGSDNALIVQADFSYPQNLLQYVSTDTNSSAFGVSTPSTGGSGSVDISRGNTQALTGKQLVANVSFKVIAAGTAALNFSSVCQGTSGTNCIVVSSDGTSNIASASTGASFTLSNPVSITQTCPSGTTGTYPNCTATTPPSSGSGSSGSGSTGGGTTTKPPTSSGGGTKPASGGASGSGSSNSYTPPNSVSPVIVGNNGQVKTSQPVNVQPATIQVQGVKEVDYYLNHKLVYVSKTPPYTYHLDTKHLLDGTYSLVSKTVYSTGNASTSTQKVFVTNPLSLEQIWLFAKHYLVLPVLIILGALIVWRAFVHLKRMWWFGGGNSSGSGGGGPTSYNKQSEPPVIRPTTMVSQTETAEDGTPPIS